MQCSVSGDSTIWSCLGHFQGLQAFGAKTIRGNPDGRDDQNCVDAESRRSVLEHQGEDWSCVAAARSGATMGATCGRETAHHRLLHQPLLGEKQPATSFV